MPFISHAQPSREAWKHVFENASTLPSITFCVVWVWTPPSKSAFWIVAPPLLLYLCVGPSNINSCFLICLHAVNACDIFLCSHGTHMALYEHIEASLSIWCGPHVFIIWCWTSLHGNCGCQQIVATSLIFLFLKYSRTLFIYLFLLKTYFLFRTLEIMFVPRSMCSSPIFFMSFKWVYYFSEKNRIIHTINPKIYNLGIQ